MFLYVVTIILLLLLFSEPEVSNFLVVFGTNSNFVVVLAVFRAHRCSRNSMSLFLGQTTVSNTAVTWSGMPCLLGQNSGMPCLLRQKYLVEVKITCFVKFLYSKGILQRALLLNSATTLNVASVYVCMCMRECVLCVLCRVCFRTLQL